MYTEGKWEIEDGWNVVCKGKLVANCGGYIDNYSAGSKIWKESNANLIAAAPDMYKALKRADIFLNYNRQPLEDKVKWEVAKALDKAEGK